MCKNESGECKIKCGKGYYRNGDYCYHCDAEDTVCEECDGNGNCKTCITGLIAYDDRCMIYPEQYVLAKIAEQIENNTEKSCQAPDFESCQTETECTGECDSSLTFTIGKDSEGKLTSLFGISQR